MATKQRIGLRQVRALKIGTTIWDLSLPGFGARRQKGDAVSYVLFYRTQEGRQRWFTIGRHGAPWTPETAREESKRILGEVAHNADPAAEKRARRNAKTVAELCDAYLADAEAGRLLTRRKMAKKASTLAIDAGRIERHIKPLLGRRGVAAVTCDDIETLLHDIAAGKTAVRTKTAKKRGLARVRGGKAAANRVIGLLGAIFTYAVRCRMRPDNPVRGIVLFADGKRERRLSDDEYTALGNALREAEAKNIWPAAIAATRFLALTGWRSGEALALRWSEIDLARRTAMLGDTKTGASMRPLSNATCDVLRSITRSGELVFPATRRAKPDENGGMRKARTSIVVIMSGFKKMFKKITSGKLPTEVTPHTLRHSFTSLAADLGYSEPTIAAMVGHKGRTMTSRYIHAADTVLLAAADEVAKRIVELMGEGQRDANVVALRPDVHRA
jgi:integrase